MKTKNAPKALKRKINLKFFCDMGVPILGEGGGSAHLGIFPTFGVPKCAGMGCDIPDIRLTVCIGECPNKNINELSFVRASQRCLGAITDVGEGWS